VSYQRPVPFGDGICSRANIHVVEAGGLKHGPITHKGETLGYLIEGQLELAVETSVYTL
jgi:hypothetical protein